MPRHFVFCNEKAGISAFDVSDALEYAAEFVGKAVMPGVLVSVGFDEVSVFKNFACYVVDDGANEVDG